MNPPLTRLTLLIAAAIVLIPSQIKPQVILKEALSPRITNYRIDARLDPEIKTIHGEMAFTWTNPSAHPVDELQFHLYLNAFKNTESLFLKGRRTGATKEDDFGFCDILEVRDAGNRDLSAGLSFTGREGPSASADQTVASLRLPVPVLPGETFRGTLLFTSQLPKIIARTGYNGDYFFVAQWFPKLGVYEPAGMRGRVTDGWNCHPFHPSSEFYANHSLYEVAITLPEEFIVGSGGMLIDSTLTDGWKTLRYRAEDIVDFAWTASRDYRVVSDQWNHVTITCLMQPEHLRQAGRHIRAARHALEYLTQHVGPYPWPYLTIIDPPTYAMGAAGMEYTTLITAGTFYGLPEGIRAPEMVTVHEFGHAYFMGILASNEFEDPWLDEGINSYWENRIMDWAYGEKRAMLDFPFLHIGDVEFARIQWLGAYGSDFFPSSGNSWSFPRGTYGASVYQKPATMLNTLERIIGQNTMDEIFKRYYAEWAFRHPATLDFVQVANRVTAEIHGETFGPDLNWFFDQFLFGTATVDYGVRSVASRPETGKAGLFDREGKRSFREPQSVPGLFRSNVQLERNGDGIIPVEILVTFSDGEQILERWDGRERTKDLIYTRSSKVVSAIIDPERKILLDQNLLNNSYTLTPKKAFAWKWASRFLFFIQNLIHSLTFFI
ncbi:MAG: M1 family metallopeptidase [Bacteroidales bacterium]